MVPIQLILGRISIKKGCILDKFSINMGYLFDERLGCYKSLLVITEPALAIKGYVAMF
jgi:hypothetical protein